MNPPIDLPRAVRAIDRLADLKDRYTARQRDDIESYAAGVSAEAARRDIDDPGYFVDWGQRLKLNEQAIRYLIGTALRQPVGDALYAASLAPRLERPQERGARLERLASESSFKAIAPALRGDPRVFLMHNADDFLVSREDLELAMEALDGRATLYPRGGHLGNLWHPRNRRDIVSVFEPLRRGRAANPCAC